MPTDLRQQVPVTYWTMTVGLVALAGVPPFSGFFSKEAILGAAETPRARREPVASAPPARRTAGWS